MNIFNKIRTNNFIKSVFLIVGGTAFAQAINVILSPLITRIYSPNEYGILTVFTAILGMLAVISSFKYEWGIAIADDDDKAINVMGLSFIVLIVFVCILFVVLLFGGNVVLSFMNGEVLYAYRLYIPLGVFFIGIYNILIQWSFRKKNYKVISKTKLSQSAVQNSTHILFGVLNMGAVALIVGRILGQSMGIMTLLYPFYKNNKNFRKRISWNDIVWAARRYINFPLFSSFSQFLNTASVQLPVLFISAQYGSAAIGFFGLANSIINLPTTLIGVSVGDVFYGEAASIGRTNPDKLKKLSIKVVKKLVIIGLIPLMVIVFIGPQLFAVVFGSEWVEAGRYARIISVLAYTRLVFIPVSRIYSVFEKQKQALFLDALRIILIFIVFYLSRILNLDSFFAIKLYTISLSFVYFITFIYAQIIINQEVEKM